MTFGFGPIGSGAMGNNNLRIIEVSDDGQLILSAQSDTEYVKGIFEFIEYSNPELIISGSTLLEQTRIYVNDSDGNLVVVIPTITSTTLYEYSLPAVDLASDTQVQATYNLFSGTDQAIYLDLTNPFVVALGFGGIGTNQLTSTIPLDDAILSVFPVTITCALTDHPEGVDVVINSTKGMDTSGIAWVKVDDTHLTVWSYDPAFHILTDTPERAAAATAIGFNETDVLIEVPMPPPDPAYVGSTALVQALVQNKTLIITIKETPTSSTTLVVNSLTGDSQGYHWEVISGYLVITRTVMFAISGSSSDNLLVFSRSTGNLALSIPTVTSATLYEISTANSTLASRTDTYTILLEYSTADASNLSASTDFNLTFAQESVPPFTIDSSTSTQTVANTLSSGNFLVFVGATEIEIENITTTGGLTLRGRSRPAITANTTSSSSITIAGSTNEYAIYHENSAVGIELSSQTAVEVPFVITNIQLAVNGITGFDFVRGSNAAVTLTGKTDTAVVDNEKTRITNTIAAATVPVVITNVTREPISIEINSTSVVAINWEISNVALEISADTALELFFNALPNGATETSTRRPDSRQVAYLSHVRYGMFTESEMSFHPAPPESETDDFVIEPPKRPLGDLGRFLQNFGNKKVSYSYDSNSQTATARFSIDSDVEVGNFLQKKVLDELLDSDDSLLLGMTNISEDSLIMYSESTGELWNMARIQDRFAKLRDQDDMDLLGISDQEINILS